MSIKGLLKANPGCPSSSSASSASRPGSVSWHPNPREQIPDFPPLQPRDDESDEGEEDDEDDDENQIAHKRRKN